MRDASDAARAYLKDALAKAGVPFNVASRMVGKADTYIHQYVTYGKPRWLSQAIIDVLVACYGIDGERLKEPPPKPRLYNKSPGGDRDNQLQINAPHGSQIAEDASTLQLLSIWAAIPESRREMALRVLRQFISSKSSSMSA